MDYAMSKKYFFVRYFFIFGNTQRPPSRWQVMLAASSAPAPAQFPQSIFFSLKYSLKPRSGNSWNQSTAKNCQNGK